MTGGSGDRSDRCWLVARRPDGRVEGGVAPLPEVPRETGPLVHVAAAGFNYKDALACSGHPGVAKTLPLIPGIDAAGTLLEACGGLPAGTPVVATGNGLGETRPGGFATLLRPPAEAVVPLPAGLSAREAMALGTAGLTVLLALDRLAGAAPPGHAPPRDAEWLVTGASGGVGMLAVAALAAAGRRVVACSRKPALAAVLRGLGAAAVIAPNELRGDAGKPLHRGRWAGVIDTVGGPILADALKSVLPGGVVAAIGMAAGVDLPTTVYPFILRGVTLCGIDSATLPTQAERAALWPRLAALWPHMRDTFPVTLLALDDVGEHAEAMLGGTASGRAVVLPAARVERHSINLAAAWDPDSGGAIWRRSFGRPSGVGPGDRVRLVVAAPGDAAVDVNGTALPPLRSGPAQWSHDVTGLLGERNLLTLTLAAARSETSAVQGRMAVPESLGRPSLEIVSLTDDS
ncbi:MAG: zinc-binding dehydrogenase [Planctomycetia bacterium]